MSSKITQYSVVLACFISFASYTFAGEIHAGLKNAVDAGNVSLAKNMVEKIGVTDIYCPANLNVKDAEKIYAHVLKKDPLRIVYCAKHDDENGCDVSHSFKVSYLEASCNAKQEKYNNICKELYYAASDINQNANTFLPQWLQEKKGICLSKETINTCKFFYDHVSDPSLKMDVLRILDQKKLLDFKLTKTNEKNEESCTKKKKKNFDRNKCLREVNRRHRNRVAECNSPGHRRTAAVYDLCMSGAVSRTTSEERDCENDEELVCQSKKVTKKEFVIPFLNDTKELYNSKFVDWREMNDAWVKDVSILKKYIDEETEINDLINFYNKNKGDLSINDVVGLCKLSPTFDKKIQKKIGFELFSCKNILKNYPISCDEDSIRTFGTTLYGTNTIKYACEKGKWRGLKKNEDIVGVYSISMRDLSNTPCEENIEVQSKFNSELSYKCVNGGWIAKIKNEQMLVDTRNWTYYKIKQIGDQVWMVDNLNFETNDSWCYNNITYNCDLHGRLYTWAAAIDSTKLYDNENGMDCGYGKVCDIPAKLQGICPKGWHLPDSTEWETLYSAMGSSPYAMQAKGYKDWPKATDAYNFSATPAGYRSFFYTTFYYNKDTFFWSATEYNRDVAYFWYLAKDVAFLTNDRDSHKSSGFSVRCIQD